MDEPLKNLMQDLGNAINDSLSESDRIAEAIGEIKRAGYDVFLVLEATIGFNKRDDGNEASEDEPAAEPERKRGFESAGKDQVHHPGSPIPEGPQDRRGRGVPLVRPAIGQLTINLPRFFDCFCPGKLRRPF